MRRRALTRIACLLLLITCATAAWPQSTGSIIGIARVLRGTFPEPILVSLQLRGATLATTYTDPEGRFAFNNLATNPYRVVIDDDHYAPVTFEVNVRPDVMTINILQVILVARDVKSTATGGPYVVSPSDLTKNYPKNAIKEYERGVKMESEGKADEAIEHYRKAIKAAPDLAVAHNNLGSIYVAQSAFQEAHTELEQSIRLAPGDSKAYFNMANLMLLTGKLQESEHYLQEGFRKQPDSAFGFFVQGSVLERAGKLEDAERALRHALDLNPKMTRPHLELVNLYLRQQRPADAISELHKFLQVAPTDPFAPKAREVLNKLQSAGSSPRP